MTSVRFQNKLKRLPQHYQLIDNSSSSITELVSIMKRVNVKAPEAKENEKSMDDNNGKRVKYKVIIRVKK